MEEIEQFWDIHSYFKGEISNVMPSRFEEFRKYLCYMTRRLRKNLQDSDIQDIVQEVTMRLMVMAKENRIHTSFLGAAHWAIMNVLKRYKLDTEIGEWDERISSNSNVEKSVETKVMVEKLKEEIDNLPENEQKILYKRYVLDMKLVEIAKDMGIKPDSLRAQHKRIVDKLRNKLTIVLI